MVERRLAATRSQARARILAGQVQVDGRRVDKAGTLVAENASLQLDERPRYVSRGGDKLEGVLAAAGVDPAGRVCLDVGASTGGFTDCLLQHGAAAVAAVDVGYGQFDWKLRNDARVLLLERCNARHLTAAQLAALPRPPDLVVVDVSFIGVAKVLPALAPVCARPCDALVLVKPQFEAGPERVQRGGVVRSADVRRACLRGVAEAARALGWEVYGAHPSALRGPAGNWECFLHLRLGGGAAPSPHDPIGELDIPDDRP